MHSRISHHTSQVPRDMFKHVANFCGQFLCEFHVFSVGNTMDIVVNIESQVERFLIVLPDVIVDLLLP